MWGSRARGRIAAAWRRWRTSLFATFFVLFNFPKSKNYYFFFLTLEEDELEEESLDELRLLRLLNQLLSTDLFSGLDSHFSLVYKNVPMPFFTAKSAFVVRLRSLGFFRLSSDLNSHSLVIDIFSIHFLNSFVYRLIWIKNLHFLTFTMKA
jgi:hypothetical protein